MYIQKNVKVLYFNKTKDASFIKTFIKRVKKKKILYFFLTVSQLLWPNAKPYKTSYSNS
jgi:hypothetical protein